jgi:dTDP-4-dehydrorhamnose 3,5-epimerase-like enzyme
MGGERMKVVSRIDFKELGDERGKLVIIEGGLSIPFDIKRIFYIYSSDAGVVRGQHANRHSEFVLVNVAGSCSVKTLDGRGNEEIYRLNEPNVGIHLAPMIWKDMYDFSPDSVLLVLSNEHYDPLEYIKDWEAFVKEVAKNDA